MRSSKGAAEGDKHVKMDRVEGKARFVEGSEMHVNLNKLAKLSWRMAALTPS